MSTNREDSSEEYDDLTSDEEPQSGLEPQQTTAWPVLPPPYSSPEEEESETELDSDSDLMQRPIVETHLKPLDDSNLRFTLVKVFPNSSDSAGAKKSEKSGRESSLFQRIWSEGDEIVILKGMIEYVAKYKTDPTHDLDVFHSSIREELQTDGSRAQLLDKIRRMRKKLEKKIKSGKGVITFSKPHEQRVYDLSKMIWGDVEKAVAVDGGVVRRRSGRKKGSTGEVVEKKRRRVERMMMDGGELFESGEKEWKTLRVEEVRIYLKQLELRVVQTKLVLAALMKQV